MQNLEGSWKGKVLRGNEVLRKGEMEGESIEGSEDGEGSQTRREAGPGLLLTFPCSLTGSKVAVGGHARPRRQESGTGRRRGARSCLRPPPPQAPGTKIPARKKQQLPHRSATTTVRAGELG